jgi:hypothetical protein
MVRDPQGLSAIIQAGDRWRGSDGSLYVVTWVGKMGVVGYRRQGAAADQESVKDVVRFVHEFARESRNEDGMNRAA